MQTNETATEQIKIKPKTRKLLDAMREHPRETYDDLVYKAVMRK